MTPEARKPHPAWVVAVERALLGLCTAVSAIGAMRGRQPLGARSVNVGERILAQRWQSAHAATKSSKAEGWRAATAKGESAKAPF